MWDVKYFSYQVAKGYAGFWDVKSVSIQAAHYMEGRGPHFPRRERKDLQHKNKNKNKVVPVLPLWEADFCTVYGHSEYVGRYASHSCSKV